MSGAALSWGRRQYSRIKKGPAVKLALIELCLRSRNDLDVTVNISGMARDLGMSRNGLKQAFRKLESAGLIKVMGRVVRLDVKSGTLGEGGHSVTRPEGGHSVTSSRSLSDQGVVTECTENGHSMTTSKEKEKKKRGLEQNMPKISTKRGPDNVPVMSFDADDIAERQAQAKRLGLPYNCPGCGAWHRADQACEAIAEAG